MNNDDKAGCIVNLFVLLLLAILILGSSFWSWYKAGIQSDLWKREGIEITQWEVFLGAKPAQRLIEIK